MKTYNILILNESFQFKIIAVSPNYTSRGFENAPKRADIRNESAYQIGKLCKLVSQISGLPGWRNFSM